MQKRPLLARLYDNSILKHPKWALVFLSAFLAFSCYWIKDFRLDASTDSLVLESDEDLKYSREIRDRYKANVFVIVTYAPKDELFSEKSLKHLKDLRDELKKLERVSSVTTLLDIPLLQNPPVPLKDIRNNIKTLESDDINKELAIKELHESPLYRNLIVSPDLRSSAIQVNFHIDENYMRALNRRAKLREKEREEALSIEEQEELKLVSAEYDRHKEKYRVDRHEDIASIRGIVDKYRADASLYLGGVPMVADDIIVFIKNDLRVFSFGMLCFLILALGVIFKRLRWVSLPMLCCAFSVITMLGLLGLSGWEVTVVSSNFVSLQLIFTMSLAIHLVVRYRELLRLRHRQTHLDLIRETVRTKFIPCLYSILTTIAGFSSLVVSDIVPVVNFGLMMTMGLCVSLIVTFVFFPTFLLLMHKLDPRSVKDFGLPFTSFFARVTEKHGRVIIMASLMLAVINITGITKLEVENSFIDYFKKPTEIYQGMKFIDQKLGGTTPLDVIIDFKKDTKETSPEPESAADDEFDMFEEFEEEAGDSQKYWFTSAKLEKIERVHNYMEGLEATGKVLSLATLWKIALRINNNSPLDDFTLALLFSQMPERFKKVAVNPYVSVEHDQARITVRIKDSMKSLRRNAFLNQVRSDLKEKLGLKEDEFRLTGLMVLYNNMLQSLFNSQIRTIGYTVVALMLMFIVLFRSFKISLIAIFPNLLSSSVVLGVMGWGGIPLDVMTITIVAISVGIAVDNTIHYLHRFEYEFKKDFNYIKTMHRCHGSIGNAMYYTSMTIIVGFSILVFSNFIPSILFGLLTALSMAVALVAALSLLPRLIILFKPFGTGKI
ncbi:RND family transporter [Elusimicrobiota bacterium]